MPCLFHIFFCYTAGLKWSAPMFEYCLGSVWSVSMSCCMYQLSINSSCSFSSSWISVFSFFCSLSFSLIANDAGCCASIGQWWWKDPRCLYQLFDKGVPYVYIFYIYDSLLLSQWKFSFFSFLLCCFLSSFSFPFYFFAYT